jgi:hypothetical protein
MVLLLVSRNVERISVAVPADARMFRVTATCRARMRVSFLVAKKNWEFFFHFQKKRGTIVGYNHSYCCIAAAGKKNIF